MTAKIAKWITPIVFLTLIFFFTVANIINPDKARSESENRQLAQRPKFEISTLFSGEYIEKTEKYITDQFVFRDKFVGAKTNSDFLIGKRDTNGVYFGKEDYLFEVYDENSVDKELLNKNIDRVNMFLENQIRVLGNDHVYAMLIPSASQILTDKLPPLSPQFDQISAYEKVSLQYPKNYIDVAKILSLHKNEYIYYKTDHHWTTLGAYYAYTQFCEKIGITPLSKSDFEVQTVSDEFYGTLYSKARLLTTKSDTINIYVPHEDGHYALNYNLGQKKTSNLYDESYLSKRDKYSYFLSGNNAVVDIKTANKNSKTLLMLKDSFSHSLAPFLVNHFERVILLDLRYYNGSIDNFIKENKVTDAIAIYHFSTMQSDDNISKLVR